MCRNTLLKEVKLKQNTSSAYKIDLTQYDDTNIRDLNVNLMSHIMGISIISVTNKVKFSTKKYGVSNSIEWKI